MLLAMLSEFPEPQQGESICMLSLTTGVNGTYRLKALTPGANGREIGRWISNCPLTVAESALLWISRFQWSIQQVEGALDVNEVLNQVENLVPMHPQDPVTGAFIHPLDQAALLLSNIPPKDPSSPETGAVLQLGTVVGQPSQPLLSGPQQQPIPTRARRRGQITGEARETALFLRNLVHGLRDGASLKQINESARDYFSDEEEDEYPPSVYELAGQILNANPRMPEDTALTQAVQIWQNQRPIQNEPAAPPPLPRGIRALRPNERLSHIESVNPRAPQPIPENSEDRRKVERTWSRAVAMSRRADQVSPLPPGLRPALHGIPLPPVNPAPPDINRAIDRAGNPVMASQSTPEVEVQLIPGERATLIPTRGPVHLSTAPLKENENGGGQPLLNEDLDRIAAEQIAAAETRTAKRQARIEAARSQSEKTETEAPPFNLFRVGSADRSSRPDAP